MRIQFNFALSTDDYKELVDNFETIEFVEKPWNEDKECSYEQTVVDTKDLITLEFDDYIKQWLDAWYKLEMIDWVYMITI